MLRRELDGTIHEPDGVTWLSASQAAERFGMTVKEIRDLWRKVWRPVSWASSSITMRRISSRRAETSGETPSGPRPSGARAGGGPAEARSGSGVTAGRTHHVWVAGLTGREGS